MSRTQGVSPVRRSTVTVALAAMLIVAGGCAKTLNMEGAQKAISEGINQQLGLEIASVTCPAGSRPLKAGDVFECTATPKIGGSTTVTVTQKDDQGNIKWEVTKSDGLLNIKLLEGKIAEGLPEAGSTVACGAARWRVAKAGDTFDCEIKDHEGQATTLVVTVKDAAGNVGWAAKE